MSYQLFHPAGITRQRAPGHAAARNEKIIDDQVEPSPAVAPNEFSGIGLDAPELDPFWAEASRLGIYVFIHPVLKLEHAAGFDADDMARSVGREFSLVQAVVRLVNGGGTGSQTVRVRPAASGTPAPEPAER